MDLLSAFIHLFIPLLSIALFECVECTLSIAEFWICLLKLPFKSYPARVLARIVESTLKTVLHILQYFGLIRSNKIEDTSSVLLVPYERYDDAHWINALLKTTWTYSSSYAAGKLQGCIEEILFSSRANILQAVKLESISLGTVEPIISDFKLISKEKSIFEFDMKWESDIIVLIELTLGGNHAKCMIRNIVVKGHMQVELTNIVPNVPFFKYARVSFLKRPDIQLELKFKDAEFAHTKMKQTKVGKIAGDLFAAKLIDEMKNIALFPHCIDILL